VPIKRPTRDEVLQAAANVFMFAVYFSALCGVLLLAVNWLHTSRDQAVLATAAWAKVGPDAASAMVMTGYLLTVGAGILAVVVVIGCMVSLFDHLTRRFGSSAP
jgi:preprotein translocase subunit SecE